MATIISEQPVMTRTWGLSSALDFVQREYAGKIVKRGQGFDVYNVKGGGQAKITNLGSGKARVDFYRGKCSC